MHFSLIASFVIVLPLSPRGPPASDLSFFSFSFNEALSHLIRSSSHVDLGRLAGRPTSRWRGLIRLLVPAGDVTVNLPQFLFLGFLISSSLSLLSLFFSLVGIPLLLGLLLGFQSPVLFLAFG